MARIVKTRGICWENIFRVGRTVVCEHDCQVGDIVDECFVLLGRSLFDNHCRKGDYTIIVPLTVIDIAETNSDLSQYGFIKVGEVDKEDRWMRK